MKNFETRVCQRCGKEYQPTGNQQKYCVKCGPIANRENVARIKKAAYSANPEKFRKQVGEYRKANPEKAHECAAKWAKANPELCRLRSAVYRKANPETGHKQHVKWAKANQEAFAVYRSKRREAKYANTPLDEMLTSAEWLTILAEANGHCAYCDKEAKLTLDHVIPLSKGGKHSKDNVVPACTHCNSSKGNKTLEEWNPAATGKGCVR